jgi:predicted Zn-ribbon and HTH transcriptional regulator
VPKPVSSVPERAVTIRAALHEALLGRPLSARELSMRVSVSEKDIAEHLEHLERSVRSKGERLVVKPAECLGCGYVFKDRKRLADPGSCPRCQGEHIASPTFRIEAAPAGQERVASKQPRRRAGGEDDE